MNENEPLLAIGLTLAQILRWYCLGGWNVNVLIECAEISVHEYVHLRMYATLAKMSRFHDDSSN